MQKSDDNVTILTRAKQKYRKRNSAKKRRKLQRNTKRRQRRKRSETRYYHNLQTTRRSRSSEELCKKAESFTVFDLGDMDWAPSLELTGYTDGVADWHKAEQVAYWKSRALSLEYENKMLHQHLRNFYAGQVHQYQTCLEGKTADCIENDTDEGSTSETMNEAKTESETRSFVASSTPVDPKIRDEMIKLYGEAAPKIMGMETALQLNYKRILDKEKPEFWPRTPLNLKLAESSD